MAELFAGAAAASAATSITRTVEALQHVEGIVIENTERVLIERILLETDLLSAMTLESALMLDRLASSPPRSAVVALRLCERNIYTLKEILEKNLRLELGMTVFSEEIKADMENALEALRVSTGLLRQVAADAVTHELTLESTAVASMSREHTFPEQKEHPSPKQKEYPLLDQEAESTSDADSVRGNRQMYGPDSAPSPTPLGSGAVGSSDLFKQPGSVCLASATGPHAVWHPAWINLDTGSDFNLISSDVLKEMNFCGPYEEPKPTYATTLGGNELRLEQRVKLRWGFHKSMKLMSTRFYIVADAPFDVLIGKSLIANRDLIDESRYLFLNLKVFGRNKAEKQRTAAKKEANDHAAMVEDKVKLSIRTGGGRAPTGPKWKKSSGNLGDLLKIIGGALQRE